MRYHTSDRSGCSRKSASHAPGIRGLTMLAIPCSWGMNADCVLVLRKANRSWVYGYALSLTVIVVISEKGGLLLCNNELGKGEGEWGFQAANILNDERV